MTMNQSFADGLEGQDEFIRLMEAQLEWTKTMIGDYLINRPWSYGSIDSADYMEAALRLSSEFVDASLTDPVEFMKKLSYDSLMSDFATDGICPELWEKYPDPEEA